MLHVTELISGGTIATPRLPWVQPRCLHPLSYAFSLQVGARWGKEPHTDDSANNPKRLTVSLKAIDITMEASTTCFHPDFYITLYLKTCIKLAPVDFARKADFFKVHTFSPRDVDISPVAPSPSHPS